MFRANIVIVQIKQCCLLIIDQICIEIMYNILIKISSSKTIHIKTQKQLEKISKQGLKFQQKNHKKSKKKQKKMQKRLVSENMIQCPNMNLSSQPSTNNPISTSCCQSQFTAYASYVAYRTDQNNLRIKMGSKDVKETQIKLDGILRWYLCGGDGRVYVVMEGEKNIDVFVVEVLGNQIKCKVVEKISNAKNSVPLKDGIAYLNEEKTIKIFQYQTHTHKTITTCNPQSQIIPHEGSSVFLLTSTPNPILQLYQLSTLSATTSINSSLAYEQSPLIIDYIKNPIAIFKDQFVFEDKKQSKQIQIYDITMSRLVGKFGYQGTIARVFLKGNVFVLVAVKENMDRYYFYTLSQDIDNNSVITHRSVSEKGRASCYQAYLCTEEQAELITQGKPTKIEKQLLTKSKQDKILILYVQPLKKAKIQLLKISSAKIKQEAFKQKQLNTVIISKTQAKDKTRDGAGKRAKEEKDRQNLEIEKARVAASMNHKKNDRVEELQKQIIQKVVELKMKGLMDKFQKLEQRIINIESQIAIIYNKIEKSIQNINREEIQRNVEKLFDRVTPQFQSYFKEVFRQISGVLDQGVNYYSMKLAKQSEIHRQAFNQVINMTFDAAQEISQLGRKELNHSQKTTESLQKLLLVRKKWEHQLLQFAEAFKPSRGAVDTSNYEVNLSSQPLSPDKKSPPQGQAKRN